MPKLEASVRWNRTAYAVDSRYSRLMIPCLKTLTRSPPGLFMMTAPPAMMVG